MFLTSIVVPPLLSACPRQRSWQSRAKNPTCAVARPTLKGISRVKERHLKSCPTALLPIARLASPGGSTSYPAFKVHVQNQMAILFLKLMRCSLLVTSPSVCWNCFDSVLEKYLPAPTNPVMCPDSKISPPPHLLPPGGGCILLLHNHIHRGDSADLWICAEPFTQRLLPTMWPNLTQQIA